MKLSELFEAGATRGYDTSEKNREHYDDYKEWLRAVHQAGGDVDPTYVHVQSADAWNGRIGQWDDRKKEGWIVDKFVKESPSAYDSMVMNDKRVQAGKAALEKAGITVARVRPLRDPKSGGFVFQYELKSVADAESVHKALDKIWPDGFGHTLNRVKIVAKRASMNEGMSVVKNKDGKEKRFNPKKPGVQQEIEAWKNSSSPKKAAAARPEKFSQEYWAEKQSDYDFDGKTPWARIESDEVADQFEKIAKANGLGQIEDWTLGTRGYVPADGIKQVACVTIRMMFSFGKEDDLGIPDEELERSGGRVSDTQNIKLRRDTKNPKKLVFAGYN